MPNSQIEYRGFILGYTINNKIEMIFRWTHKLCNCESSGELSGQTFVPFCVSVLLKCKCTYFIYHMQYSPIKNIFFLQ